MSKTLPLNETERNLLVNALHVAAEQYDRDAVTVAAEFGTEGRTVKQFRGQAESARRWAELIENASEVIIR